MSLTQGDFNRMVGQHGPTLYRIAYRLVGDRHEAEDVVQEAFRSAWKSRQLFNDGQSDRAWLIAILRRRVVDHWRRARGPTLPGNGSLDVAAAAVDPLRDECDDVVQRALARLPAELRDTLLLVVVGELTHQETADLLGIPLGTVLSRVSRARRRLRTYLAPARADREE